MSETKQYITDTIQEIQDTMELFYQQQNQDALSQFNVVLGKMANMIDSIFAYREEHQDFVLDEEKIQESLVMAMNALQDEDMVLLADTIQYEFVEYVNQLADAMV